MQVESFSQGKVPERNEDAFGFNDTTLVLSDGATSRSGLLYDGKTGGEILSNFLVEETLKSDLSGIPLIRHLSDNVMNLYREMNPQAVDDPYHRFAATYICARITEAEIHIVQVADSWFRINGTDIYSNKFIADQLNVELRSQYIQKTGDIEGGWEYVKPLYEVQYRFQNKADSAVGFGAMDGTEVPEKFIKIYTFPREEIQTIEIASDGYHSLPQEITIEAYEKEFDRVNEVDPHKYLEYKDHGKIDDRTVLIARL